MGDIPIGPNRREVRDTRYKYNDIIELRRSIFLPILFAIIGAIIAISLFGTLEYNIKGMEFKASAYVGEGGYTIFNIPLVGSVRAKTHLIPIELSLELRNIDLEPLKAVSTSEQTTQEFLHMLEPEAKMLLHLFIRKLLLLGVAGGLIGVVLVDRKHLNFLIGGALLGITLVASLIAGIYWTYDIDSFASPEYKGLIQAAPWVMSGLEKEITRGNNLGAKLQVLADNLYRLFENIDNLQPLGMADGDIKLLHISDIHNNIGAFEFIEKVVSTFGVTAIIDTGDMTDFGTGFEIDLAMKIRKLNIPYIFVPGNHDSPVSLGKLRSFSNVRVLSDEFYYIEGLEILGIADPASERIDKINLSEEDIKEVVGKTRELLNGRDKTPDILAVHNGEIASYFVSEIPVILHGHDHQLKVTDENGSVIVDAGTSGAAGIRGLQVPHGVPYSVALLHFAYEDEENKFSKVNEGYERCLRLIAVDTIKVNSLNSGFTLERRLINYP